MIDHWFFIARIRQAEHNTLVNCPACKGVGIAYEPDDDRGVIVPISCYCCDQGKVRQSRVCTDCGNFKSTCVCRYDKPAAG